jgi:hypothetical protein
VRKPVEYTAFRTTVGHLSWYWLRVNQAPPGDGGPRR